MLGPLGMGALGVAAKGTRGLFGVTTRSGTYWDEYSKNHWIVHFKRVTCVACERSLSTAATEVMNEERNPTARPRRLWTRAVLGWPGPGLTVLLADRGPCPSGLLGHRVLV